MKKRFIGKSEVSFENGEMYEVEHYHDWMLGECYSILDESGGWYLYSKEFVEENFE